VAKPLFSIRAEVSDLLFRSIRRDSLAEFSLDLFDFLIECANVLREQIGKCSEAFDRLVDQALNILLNRSYAEAL